MKSIIENNEIVVMRFVIPTKPPSFQTKFSKMLTNIEEASGQSKVPQTHIRTISCKAQNSHVEYPSREYEYDIKESEGNMFNLIFKREYTGTETTRELRSCRIRIT